MESIDRKRVWTLILSILVAASVTFLLLSFFSAPSTVAIGPAQAGEVRCLDFENYNTLEKLTDCICDYMPHRYSVDNRHGFITPTLTEMTQWRQVVAQMMEGECDAINLSGYDWGNDFTVTTFTDTQNSSPYCVFMETTYNTYPCGARVTHGWGTFIVNPYPCRELSIQIAHPIHDLDTATQGIGVFKGTDSRSFLMAGTHRHANFICSACQPPPECQPGEVVTQPEEFLEADVAHNVENLFQPTVEKLLVQPGINPSVV